MTQINKSGDFAQSAKAHSSRAARFAASATGALILAASAVAVIVAGKQDTPHALLTGALALGVLVGAGTIGKSWNARRYALAIAIGGALFAGEAFNMIATADRIVAEREAAQAKVRVALGAHAHAQTAQAAAQGKYDTAVKAAQTRLATDVEKARAIHEVAVQAKLTEASKPGCKDRCVALLDGAEKSAKVALDNAREGRAANLDETDAAVIAARADLTAARNTAAANPKPEASESPLADRLGWAPWVLDLLIAGLLSLAANGLGGALVAFGTHGQPDAPKAPVDPRPRKSRRGATTRDAKVVAFVDQYRKRNGTDPSIPAMLAQFPKMATSTAQRYQRGNGGKVATLRVA